MEYGPDKDFRSREQPSAADWAQSSADDAKKKSRDTQAQFDRLTQLLMEKGVISLAELAWVTAGGPRNV